MCGESDTSRRTMGCISYTNLYFYSVARRHKWRGCCAISTPRDTRSSCHPVVLGGVSISNVPKKELFGKKKKQKQKRKNGMRVGVGQCSVVTGEDYEFTYDKPTSTCMVPVIPSPPGSGPLESPGAVLVSENRSIIRHDRMTPPSRFLDESESTVRMAAATPATPNTPRATP